MTQYRAIGIAFLFSAAFFASQAPALAETRSVAVHSADLDLNSEAGRAELKHRIHHAIDLACGPSVGVTMEERRIFAACSKEAQPAAMAQFDVAVRAAMDRKLAEAKKPGMQVQ